MRTIIKVVMFACLLQIIAVLSLSIYIYDRNSHEAKYLAAVAENNARLAAAELVLEHRTDVQVQFSLERQSMKEYVDQKVKRALIQLNRTGGKE
jgi:hypothetical protein